MTSEATLTFGDRDEFKREQIAARVISLLTSDIDVAPMVIDGDWGTGKTEFCHKLINKFKSQHADYRVLYIDAFQADHADNPLMTVLSSVLSLLPEGAEKSTLKEKALPVLRFVSGVVAKAVTSHVLKQNADDLGENLEDVLQESANQAIDASVKALLKDHEKSQKNIQALRDCLETIAESEPIVIFVDELDRCRPDFALQMLEVIKHTFNVSNVKFVFVTNTLQLKAAINHRYGSTVNAQRYLDKFIKFSFNLPDFVPGVTSNRGLNWHASEEYFQILVKNSITLRGTCLARQDQGAFQFAKELVRTNILSLRETEAFTKGLEIYQRLSQGLNSNIIYGHQLLYIFGIFLTYQFPELTRLLEKHQRNAKEIMAAFGLRKKISNNFSDWQETHIEEIAFLIAQDCTAGENPYLVSNVNQIPELYNIKQRFFSGGRGIPENMFDPIVYAITCLRLGAPD